MMTMGDEVRRSQGGNNNAYCQDNPLAWMDWSNVQRHKDVYRFFSRIIRYRSSRRELQRARFFTGAVNERGLPDVAWHGTVLNRPGWDDPNGRALAFTLGGVGEEADLHVMMNMHWEALEFEIPPAGGRRWFRFVDTALASPEDVAESGLETPVPGETHLVSGRSTVVLVSGK